jgi:alkylation response protein AidB-like acyl-CoA dehydrogenase
VSLLKIWSTETFQRIAELTIETADACGALRGEIELGEGNTKTLDGWYEARSTTIYGGSNEIQRSIFARHVLRLPNMTTEPEKAHRRLAETLTTAPRSLFLL